MAYPSVKSIQAMFNSSRRTVVDEETAKKIRSLMEGARTNRGVEDALEAISKLIGGFGHEVIRGQEYTGGFWGDVVLAYVNTGDAYNATVFYDIGKGQWGAGAYGDWVEAYERKHGQLEGLKRRKASFMRVPGGARGALGSCNSLGATPVRHGELATYHASEAEQLARTALAKARSGRCNSGVEDLTRAAMEYGRADAHAASGNSEEADRHKATARGMLVTARNAIEGCVVSCRR